MNVFSMKTFHAAKAIAKEKVFVWDGILIACKRDHHADSKHRVALLLSARR